ncbi:MAG: hypothetical protein ABJB66_18040, partial [Gemmatimonadaceae bacterium]
MTAVVRRAGKTTHVREAAVAQPQLKRLLIDTHVWLWWNANDLRLGKGARQLLQRASEVHFSA